jgi:hypothetical protein
MVNMRALAASRGKAPDLGAAQGIQPEVGRASTALDDPSDSVKESQCTGVRGLVMVARVDSCSHNDKKPHQLLVHSQVG